MKILAASQGVIVGSVPFRKVGIQAELGAPSKNPRPVSMHSANGRAAGNLQEGFEEWSETQNGYASEACRIGVLPPLMRPARPLPACRSQITRYANARTFAIAIITVACRPVILHEFLRA